MIWRVSNNDFHLANGLLIREMCESIEAAVEFFVADKPSTISLGAWAGAEVALGVYCNQLDLELLTKGWFFKPANEAFENALIYVRDGDKLEWPIWWEDENILLSHQSVLNSDPRYKAKFDAPHDWPLLHPFVVGEGDDLDYEIKVQKAQRDMLGNLPKKVRKLVSNA